jgi:hypothetical protein
MLQVGATGIKLKERKGYHRREMIRVIRGI